MGRLITFGDSWIKGVGIEYEEGMTEKQFDEKMSGKESKHCFRRLISTRYDLENLNLSMGGSSNQTQFRLALETFFGENNIDPKGEDIVLWGITSVFRTELWHAEENKFKSIFLPQHSAVSKILASYHHDEAQELKILENQMQLWNAYFKSKGVKNYWFNVFNDHKWSGPIENFLFEGSSLLSCLINDYSPNDKYHKSIWGDTDRKIKRAKEMSLVNPFTGHPTKLGHKKLADLLSDQLTNQGRIVN